MAILGAVLLILGFVLGISVLWIVGLVLLALGVAVNFGPATYRRRIY